MSASSGLRVDVADGRAGALVQVTQTLVEAVTDPALLINLITSHVTDLVGDAATLWLTQGDERTLHTRSTTHPERVHRRLLHQLRMGEGSPRSSISQLTMEVGRPFVITDFDVRPGRHVDQGEGRSWMEQLGASSLVVVPLRARGNVLGIIGATRHWGGAAYTPADVEFIQALADCAAVALDNARLLSSARAAEESLRSQSELVDLVSDAIILVDGDGLAITWNSAAKSIYGYPAPLVLGRAVLDVLDTVDASTGQRLDWAAVSEIVRRTGRWRGDVVDRAADGRRLQLLSSMTFVPISAGPSRVIIVNRDVTDYRQVAHDAMHDPLTGLPNRRLATARLIEALERAAASRMPIAVLFVDLDDFKHINDTYGHEAGDDALRTCAAQLTRVTRTTDTVARFGGDEFVIVLETGSHPLDPGDVASRVLRLLNTASWRRAPRGDDGRHELRGLAASIGITMSWGDESVEGVLARSDAAMYQAKQAGGNRWVLDPAGDLPG